MAGCRINLNKLIAFLYAKNKHTKKKIMDILPFTIASKIKYIGINLTKEMKDIYNENLKPLMKEIGKTLENENTHHAHK